MRPIERMLKASLTFGGSGGFDQGPFWQNTFLSGAGRGHEEKIPNDFDAYAEQAFKDSGVVFTCITIRQHLFSEGRFLYQRLRGGRPGDLFGDASLRILEEPWPNGTTGELLSRMEQDASLAGNFFATTVDGRIRRLRPDWVTIVTGPGEPFALSARPIAYLYAPRGGDAVVLMPEDVVHFSPIPDPQHQWRGMSWITSILREVQGDRAASRHKAKFFEHGSVPGMIFRYDKDVSKENVAAFAEWWADNYEGTDQAYKTAHLGGGADPKVMGADMKQLDFKVTQGHGESRIAAASLVGAVIAQFSEGMQGSSLNAGNFEAARRRFADLWARPQWRMAAASLSKLVDVPSDARLWYDDRDIPFLREDSQTRAEIEQKRAQTITRLTDAGFTPESAIRAVQNEDMTLLEHTGLFSVQLQPPGLEQDVDPSPNGQAADAMVG